MDRWSTLVLNQSVRATGTRLGGEGDEVLRTLHRIHIMIQFAMCVCHHRQSAQATRIGYDGLISLQYENANNNQNTNCFNKSV